MAQIFEPVIILKPDETFIDDTSRIDSFCKLEGRITIGKYVHVASFSHLGIGGGELIMGDYSAAASGAKIITGSNSIDGLSCSAVALAEMQIVKRSKVVIGAFAVLFANAVVLPGVTLGEGAVLAAGGVATKDVPAWEVWGGVPARKIGTRKNSQVPSAADAVKANAPYSVVEQVNADLPGTWRLTQQNGGYVLHDDFGHYVQSYSIDSTASQILMAARSFSNLRANGSFASV